VARKICSCSGAGASGSRRRSSEATAPRRCNWSAAFIAILPSRAYQPSNPRVAPPATRRAPPARSPCSISRRRRPSAPATPTAGRGSRAPRALRLPPARPDEGIREIERCVSGLEAARGPRSLAVASALALLVEALRGRGRDEELRLAGERAVAIRSPR
jgi:hypothetical protein